MSTAPVQPQLTAEPDNIVLVGYRGSGKTTAGQTLAARLGWAFTDTDACIQQCAGCSIRELFAASEAHFRDLETAALANLTGCRHTVIAVGGGAVERQENRITIATLGTVVWLRADPQVLHARITAGPRSAAARPPLTSTGGLGEVLAVLAARSPGYAAVAQFEVDTTRLQPEETVAAILAALRSSEH